VGGANLSYASENGVLFNKGQTTLLQYPCGNVSATYAVPNGVTTIGNNAFAACATLVNITIPDSVTNIGAGAFEDCGLTSVVIPDSVTHFGDSAFAYCLSLTSVTIPHGLASLGNGAFEGCGLTTVAIPDSVTNIGDSAFNDCFSLSAIKVDGANLFYSDLDGVLFDKERTTLLQYPNGHASTSYVIPPGVLNVGSEAFADCANLINVTIADSVANVEDSARSQAAPV